MSIKKKSRNTSNPQRKQPEISATKIKVNVAELSEKSKRSWNIPDYYEDAKYKCMICGNDFVFTASLQRQWYEEKKKYLWMRPNKCSICYAEWLELKRDTSNFSDLLKTSLTVVELTAMSTQLERLRLFNRNKFDFSLYNRVTKMLKNKVELS